MLPAENHCSYNGRVVGLGHDVAGCQVPVVVASALHLRSVVGHVVAVSQGPVVVGSAPRRHSVFGHVAAVFRVPVSIVFLAFICAHF